MMQIGMPESVIVAGIDEAGYGPILGPLVVSAAAFELPAERQDACLWQVLRSSVTRKVSGRASRIPILDSKKLYHRPDGVARLERSVLAVMSAWRGQPPSLQGLLNLVVPGLSVQLGDYPWYRDVNPELPREADSNAVRLASAMIRRNLNAERVRVAGIWSEVLPEGHYNRLVRNTQNKAVVLSGLTLRLVQRVADAYPDRILRFFVDKQGGREHYARQLLRAFEDRRLKVLEESPGYSAYELTQGTSSWRISFHQAGESAHLTVALASMVSKYLRELLMECFNAYWQRQIPELRPTAGYYQDGLRFLREIEPHLARLGVSADGLVRER